MARPARPRYTGVRIHIHPSAGFRLRIPSDWTAFPMAEGHEGFIFGPSADTPDTVLMAEKFTLPFAVQEEDAPALHEGFEAGLQALPGLLLEMKDEAISPALMLFEARFTFLEGDLRRKRWVRAIYAGKGHLLLVAQGSTPEEFDYWLPMFYNILHTFELWPLV